ncbi:MAG: VanW family protein [Candidatus Ventricola sp.]
MSDSRQPHRRRRPQEMPPIPDEEKPVEPHRIVAADEDTPDWMVSASRVTGAAERRGAPAAKPQEGKRPARGRKNDETRAILDMNKKAADEKRGETARGSLEEPKPRKTAVSAAAKAVTAREKSTARTPKPAPRKMSKKAIARRNARIKKTIAAVLGSALLIALITAGVIGGTRLLDIKRVLDRGDGVFYPNIFVNNIPLEGKTLDEAAVLVTQQVRAQIESFSITLRTTDGSGRTWTITGEDLKMQYDVADQLDQLWAIGHTGSAASRYEQVKALEGEAMMRYTTLSYDLSSVNQILTQIKQEVDQAPVSATRVSDDTQWPPFSYTDDVPGQELDISGLNERICAMVDTLQSGAVDLSPTTVEAPVTRAYLESQIVQLSTYETAIGATSDPGRFINIEVGTKKFDKLIIKSGESVSFNKVAGKRTYANGYADAPELAYGDYRTGVGGGICQVSSTLYNAVVGAGLQVTTRYQHSLASSYVPLGLDATVQDDRLDFVFKNTTNADIYISTEYYKKKGYWYTKFTIHGRPDPNGYTYKLESEVVEEIPIPDPTYVPDKDAQYVVYDDETKQVSNGHKGYVVDVYLVTMDAKGLEVSREKKYTDTYKAYTPRVYIGVTPRETPVPDTEYLID